MPDPRRDEDPRLRQLANEQAALRRVATLVAQGVSPDELFSAVSNEVGRLFVSDQAAIGRYEPDGSSVVYVGISQGLSMIPVGTRWPLEDFLASTTVYRTGRPARQEQRDYETASGQVAETLRELNTVSRVGAPIFVEGKLWGVLLVTDTREGLPPDTEERLAKFTELVATAIANAESRAELASSEARARDLAREQAALRRVATLVAEGTSADELFSTVTDEVGRLFGAEAAVARFEADGSAMVVLGLTQGIPVVAIGTRWPLENFLASTAVYRTGRPARSDHTGHQNVTGQVADSLRQMNYVSTVAAPITVEGSLWGVMTVSDQRKPLPPDTEERVAKFTELVGTAIAEGESRSHLEQLASEQAALRRVATLVAEDVPSSELFGAVAREVGTLFGADFTPLIRYESDPSFATTLMAFWAAAGEHPRPPSRPRTVPGDLTSMIADSRKPMRVDDWTDVPGPIAEFARDQLKVRSSVGCPIVVEGRLWGALGVHSKRGPFPRDTETRLLNFCELVATAIANRNAHDEISRLAAEQAALRRVATLVAQGVSPEEVFSVVSSEVGRLFGSDQAAVARYDPDGSGMVYVGVSPGARGVSIGTRWPLEEYLSSTTVYRTGRSARMDRSDYETASGPLADSLRAMNLVSRVAAPIVVEGELWGVITVGGTREPLPPDTEQRVAKFTELVATAIANAESRAELAASRARVIAAADEARRRIERDLHDGAQQRLVTLSVALRTMQATLPAGSDEQRAEVAQIADGLAAAVQELRELSRGIHPAVLTQGGLAPALKALRRRSPVPVTLDIRFENRLPDQVEAAAYYTVSETLTNASKHASATRVRVALQLTDGELHLSIRDDGVGGADPSQGSGLTGLKDRIEALGGQIRIDSAPGSGTRIEVDVPVLQPLTSRGDSNQPPKEKRNHALKI